jgi:hypothetical protein
MTKYLPAALLLLFCATSLASDPNVVWIEAESFDDVGGWSRDTQHVDVMGSIYLLATGVGTPVEDAVTNVMIPEQGEYKLWVRCRDWMLGYSPGRFTVSVNDVDSGLFGVQVKPSDVEGDQWRWREGVIHQLEQGYAEIRIHDLTGWYGRVDAIVLATDDFVPSDDLEILAEQRVQYAGVSPEIEEIPPFDVLVVGAGPAGMGASVAAARNGARVALIQDRPVVGGNSSSEIMVPPMGYIGSPPDTINVTGICEEMYPTQGWSNFADSEHMEQVIRSTTGLSLFLNTRAYNVTLKNDETPVPLESGETGIASEIESVLAIDVRSGQRMSFTAPIVIDCTGHGWIGYYAGAEYRHGQEARSEYGEALAPVEPGDLTQGNTLYRADIVTRNEPTTFECPAWAYQWTSPGDFQPMGDHVRIRDPMIRPENYDRPAHGRGRNPGNNPDGDVVRKWYVEYGGMRNIVWDAEQIRDELIRVNLGLWNYAKNHNPATIERNRNRELAWLNYVPGVRESRRLIGPYIMTQTDFDEQIVHPDTIAFTDWGIDVHHPEGFWVDGNDCIHVYHGLRVSIPYRSLYSKNVTNLMMAGRNLSATHIAMGATRVMRPCLSMGQAAGTAAAIAVRHDESPHGVYDFYLDELQQTLIKDGCYLIDVAGCDPNDLAQQAELSASSEQPRYEAKNVRDGFNRLSGSATHAWRPADGDATPWIEFSLEKPSELDVIHITFAERAVPFMIEADGQPIKSILATSERRLVLAIDPIFTQRIRIRTAFPAEICEIRLYNESDDVWASIMLRPGPAEIEKPDMQGVFMDDTEAVFQGAWDFSTYTPPFYCGGYSTDGNKQQGEKSMTFLPGLSPGRYDVRLAYSPLENRATNTPVMIRHTGGETTVLVNEQLTPSIDGRFVSLGTFICDERTEVVVGNDNADGYVVVDGVWFAPVD